MKKRTKISDVFRERILSGTLRAGEQLPGQIELAREYGVSPVTVQRSVDMLVRQGFVRTQRRGGTFVADRLPHLNRYGLVFADTPENANTWTLFHSAIANEAIRLSCHNGLELTAYHGVDGHLDVRDYHRLIEDVRAGTVGGLIFACYPSQLLQTPLLDDPALPRVAIMGLPEIPGIPGVFGDLVQLVDRALDELAAQGRRRVAILASLGTYEHCRHHFFLALEQRGLPANPWWIQIVDRRPSAAANHCVRLLMQADARHRPDALLILDDNLVEHACAGLVAAGLRVPDEVAVTALCNFPWPPPAVLPVRRIGFDIGGILTACMDSINRQRRGESVTPSTLVPPVFEEELTRDRDLKAPLAQLPTIQTPSKR